LGPSPGKPSVWGNLESPPVLTAKVTDCRPHCKGAKSLANRGGRNLRVLQGIQYVTCLLALKWLHGHITAIFGLLSSHVPLSRCLAEQGLLLPANLADQVHALWPGPGDGWKTTERSAGSLRSTLLWKEGSTKLSHCSCMFASLLRVALRLALVCVYNDYSFAAMRTEGGQGPLWVPNLLMHRCFRVPGPCGDQLQPKWLLL
jgi:hypothetical protein